MKNSKPKLFKKMAGTPKKSPKEFSDEFTAKVKAQLDKLRLDPSQIAQVHQNFRRVTNQFDTPGPEMKQILDFNIPHDDYPVPVRLYVPHNANEDSGPCFIYLHGGVCGLA